MSGTSLDGIDVALIETDGHAYVQPIDFATIPYDPQVRAQIRDAYGLDDPNHETAKIAEILSTNAHIDAVRFLLAKNPNIKPDLIGYHGQTVYHNPARKLTIQLGNGQHMANTLGIPVIYDMRANDVSLGGQGAPLAPLYHRAILPQKTFPAVILNIGGVSNITYIDHKSILAFDTGTGNALMDDLALKATGKPYDEDGNIAACGMTDFKTVSKWMSHPYFTRLPPKSLDRDEWDIAALGPLVKNLNQNDLSNSMATLMEFTAQGIKKSCDFMPTPPKNWYVAGGGRHNKNLMNRLTEILPGKVQDISVLGWNGDATEGELFAYLAVRSHLGLALSLPSTTGVPKPATGGVLATPA